MATLLACPVARTSSSPPPGLYSGKAFANRARARSISPWRTRKWSDSGNWRTSSGRTSSGTAATKNTAGQPQLGINNMPSPAESMPPTE